MLAVLVFAATASATPYQGLLSPPINYAVGNQYFNDIQAHRGGRANTVENSLPSFAWGLIEGSTTLEMDNGITKDGSVVVWHDEEILSSKCRDTHPVVPHDSMYPYVGKFVTNLTLPQIKTLDCGSQRQRDFPLQLTYPGTRISTLQEVFDFLDCADPQHHIMMNIESKINPIHRNQTLQVNDFVQKQHALFASSHYHYSITYQSFDWRTLIAMKNLDPIIPTSALIDDETATVPNDETTSPWLGGVYLSHFNGSTLGEKVAQAAYSIGANILSPIATSGASPVPDPGMEGYIPFTTRKMIDLAHGLGMLVKPWTVNRVSVVEQLVDSGVDGIITDQPDVLRRWAQQQKLPVGPRYPKYNVLACLAKHNQRL